MRSDSFTSQLLAALARNTPAFGTHRARRRTTAGRFVAALARDTPAFVGHTEPAARGGPADDYPPPLVAKRSPPARPGLMVTADVRPEPVDLESFTGQDDVLADVEILADLEATTRRRIAAASVPVSFRRGQLLFRQGEPGDSLIMLRHGAVVAFRSGPAGEQTVVNRFYAPEVIREVSFLDGLPRSMSAEAIDDVTVLTLSRGAFMDLIHSDPRVLGAVMRFFGALVRRLTEQDADDVFLDLPGRVAKTLVRLAGGVPLAAIELNRWQLGEMVGGSRQAVNQAMDSFANRGWLRTEGRRVLITDLTALRRRAGLAGSAQPVREPPRAADALDRLDPGQQALLERLASGQTIAAAAAAEFLTIQTANRRIAQARELLGVRTTREAVVAYLRSRRVG
jgi:CRP/FNR family cyclic AMP-dependent transcriptional regulator